MPIRFVIDGIQFEADSPEEAIDAARRMKALAEPPNKNQSRTPKRTAPPSPGNNGAAPDYDAFWKNLNDNGKKIVRALVANRNGLTTDELARETGLDSVVLPPIMKHVRRAAELASVKPDTVIQRRAITVGGRPKSSYVMSGEVVEGMARMK